MALCKSCRNFDISSFSTDPDGLRGYRLENAQAQAGKGCLFCQALVVSLEDAITAKSAQKDLWIHMKMCDSYGVEDGGYCQLRVHLAPIHQSFKENNVHSEPDGAVRFRVATERGLYCLVSAR
jgi:hypothetical protein